MGEVIEIDFWTNGDIQADKMLQAIAEENPKNAFVIVWPDDGSMPTYHSSTSDVPTVLMRLQQFIHKYYNGDFTHEQ